MKRTIVISIFILAGLVSFVALNSHYESSFWKNFSPIINQTLEKTSKVTREELNPLEEEIMQMLDDLAKSAPSEDQVVESVKVIFEKTNEIKRIAKERVNITESERSNLRLESFSEEEAQKIQDIYGILENFDKRTYQNALDFEKCLRLLVEFNTSEGFCDSTGKDYVEAKEKYVETLVSALGLSAEEKEEFLKRHNKKSGFIPFTYEREKDIRES